ncbi:MAG: SoxR reducing system RseC family protein [Candidatus Cryosericum sp.]
MRTDTGIVMSRQGDTVSVVVQSHEECASCSLAQFCVSSKNPGSTVAAAAPFDVSPGDLVEISMDDSLILKVSAIMYGVPLVAFLAGVFGGYGLSLLAGLRGGMAVAMPIVSGFVLLVLGVVVSRAMARRLNVTGKVTRLIDKGVGRDL